MGTLEGSLKEVAWRSLDEAEEAAGITFSHFGSVVFARRVLILEDIGKGRGTTEARKTSTVNKER